MVFSSSLFLLYFLPVFLILYFIIPAKLKNVFALFASILFYAWGAPDFIFIVLITIVIDFYIVAWLSRSTGRKKKYLLAVSIALNIGLLLYFKYANFFVENVNALLQSLGTNEVKWMAIALPIGISFFTFQKMTYAVDVYRGVYHPLKKITDYALYILMFPQLIAGPIVRFNEIAAQIEDRKSNETNNNRITGFFRFTIGLAKKVLIANVLGEQVDILFALEGADYNTITAWLGILAYAFQIYFDFSGYSDMAIGIGRMIGFDFPENFNNPYISQNISEFWRRWHITLGRWMRDYLYIPLGGNKVSTKRMYFNLWVVFLVSGLWHGAAWNFVIWGAFHGLFLILDRLFLLKFYKRIGKVPSIIITFVIVLVGWVLFRAESMGQASDILIRMFTFEFAADEVFFNRKFYVILIAAIFFSFYGGFSKIEKWQIRLFEKNKGLNPVLFMTSIAVILLIVCLGYITSSGFNPFIYFRF
jgi:alginate O-acetyltransferase complex protein AlgI